MATKAQLRQRWNAEPGKTIRERLVQFVVPLQPKHGRTSAPLFQMLEALPYRGEVENGRDFRGIPSISGRELELTNCDFSYSGPLWDFFNCDLAGALFNEARGERNSFNGSVLCHCSFRKARFRSSYFERCDARNACFDEAWLYHANFMNADLRGASFRSADVKGACFVGANLIGCDFRGANMQEVVLNNVQVDATTDFRGANLINAYLDDHVNKAGELVGRGIDLRSAKLDATTRLGSDPKLHALEILNAALEVSSDRRDVEAMRVRQAVQRVLTEVQKEYFEDWYDRVISYLAPEELDAHDEIMNEAYRSLL